MKYGYVRSATKDTESINKQIETLKGYGVDNITIEETDRDLDKLLRELQAGDELHVVSLERLTRDMKRFLEIFQYLREKGIDLYINNTLDEYTNLKNLLESLEKRLKGRRLK